MVRTPPNTRTLIWFYFLHYAVADENGDDDDDDVTDASNLGSTGRGWQWEGALR